MKVLVTGAGGFVGTGLCKRLEERGDTVTAVHSRNCDLADADSLSQFDGQSFERIYHLAAWTQAGDFCLRHPGEQWIINQQMNTNLLTWWHERQPKAKLISIGTSCSYDPDLPLAEENYLIGRPIDSLFTYAMTKRMLHVGQMALAKQFGLRYLTVVASTLYGPGYHTDGRQMHFIFDLIRKIILGKRQGDPVVLWGDGQQKRELVYIDDFLTALLRLAETAENDLVNVGAGVEHSIADFARMICRHVGYDFGKIQFDLSRYVGARSKCLDVSKLRGLLPDLKLTPLQEGLDRTIDWLGEQMSLPTVSASVGQGKR
jgi:GDP-L-fucose synthase